MTSPCLEDAQLVALVEGTLSTDQTRDLQRHLGDCESCRSLVAGLAEPSLQVALPPTPPGAEPLI